jgi:hypothetical protein
MNKANGKGTIKTAPKLSVEEMQAMIDKVNK